MAAPPRASAGRLVVLEGIDGSGKTTVASLLADALEETVSQLVTTREPTGSAIGRALREVLADPDHDPVSEALLFTADHADHVATLRGHLAEGATILSDRYSYSCLAYQGATLAPGWPDGAGQDPIDWLQTVLAPFELEPDLVLLLDLPVDEALARVHGRAEAHEKFEAEHLLQRVQENYHRLADEHGFVTIDASGTPEETARACMDAIEAAFEEVVA